jgi:transposase
MHIKKSDLKYQERMDAVAAVQRGEEPKVVSRIMSIPLNTLYDWLARYRNGGWHALRDGHRSGRPRKVNGKILKWVYDAISMGDPRQFQFEFCLWTRRIIRAMLKKHHKIEIGLSSVSRLLKQLGLSAQRPLYKAWQQDPVAVEKWLNKEYPAIKKKAMKYNAEIYFADEASFRSDYHSGTTWSPIGVTPVVEEHRGKFGINCISAVNANGTLRFKLFDGRMNSKGFIEFLKALHSDANRTIFVIVDNASYHKSKPVIKFIEKLDGQIQLHYLPAYSPELNPDEQVWNQAKKELGRTCIENKKHMKKAVLSMLRSIQRQATLIFSFFQLKSTKYAAT